MDFSDITAVIIAISSGLMGLFAWSHSSLSKRLDKLAIDLQDRKTDADIRILIQDKMQPFSLELKFLAQQNHPKYKLLQRVYECRKLGMIPLVQ